jgi:hypothetical protein
MLLFWSVRKNCLKVDGSSSVLVRTDYRC